MSELKVFIHFTKIPLTREARWTYRVHKRIERHRTSKTLWLTGFLSRFLRILSMLYNVLLSKVIITFLAAHFEVLFEFCISKLCDVTQDFYFTECIKCT